MSISKKTNMLEHGWRWMVINDPSGYFTGRIFRAIDIETEFPEENGWASGTVFQHIFKPIQKIYWNGKMITKETKDKKPLFIVRKLGDSITQHIEVSRMRKPPVFKKGYQSLDPAMTVILQIAETDDSTDIYQTHKRHSTRRPSSACIDL